MDEIANIFSIPSKNPYKSKIWEALRIHPNFIRKDTDGNIQVKMEDDWVYVTFNSLLKYLNSRLFIHRKLNNRKHYSRIPK